MAPESARLWRSQWKLSSDTHVVEPPDLYRTRMSRQHRDAAPYTVEIDGIETWIVDGVTTAGVYAAYCPGDRFLAPDERPARTSYTNGVDSTVIEKWLADNESDGTYGGIAIPSATMMCFSIADPEVVSEVMRVYNEWIVETIDGFQSRVKPIGLVNVDNIEEAVRTVQSLRDRDFAGALIPVTPAQGHPYSSPEYEPFWAAAEEAAMPLHFHIVTNRRPWSSGTIRTPLTDTVNLHDYLVRVALTDIVLSGVLERHPGLQLVSVEHEGGWVPHWLQRMDWQYKNNARHAPEFWRFADGALPSDVARRSVYVSFSEDRAAVSMRDVIGVDHLFWGSDYPHPESTFTHSDALLDYMLEGVPEADVEKLLRGNMKTLYGFEDPPPNRPNGALVEG
jgi:predicted TIM-barrel fold metal-dependent hydrolase